ncbi:MAG: DUF2235 domain-containing protein [Pseudomonadota bacterium]
MEKNLKAGKRIVLFADGTGNSASSPAKTNVWRAYKALDISPGAGQVAFYDGGVGTSAFTPFAMLGLMFGWGLAANVRQIYKFLCHSYQPGDAHQQPDDVYILGFSRGAFTARVLAGMIADQGIIDVKKVRGDRDLDRLISAAYGEFRSRNFDPSLLSRFIGRPLQAAWVSLRNGATFQNPYDSSKNFEHQARSDSRPHSIQFVGVWDTVDAYGLPVDEMTRAWDKIVWPLTAKDRDLSGRVAHAAHALALDEQRESFEPMLWNEKTRDPSSKMQVDERINQVWFAGVHANVGGGYPDDSLAHVSLNWMLDQCEQRGLKFDKAERDRWRQGEDLNGPLYDNRAGLGSFYRYAPRHVEHLCNSSKQGVWEWLKTRFGPSDHVSNAVTVTNPKIHRSVFDRIMQSGGAYAPINLPKDYVVVDNKRVLYSTGDDPASEDAPETAAQAGNRRTLQTNAWVNVLTGKLLYFAMLATLLLFAVTPFKLAGSEKRDTNGLFDWLARVDELVKPVLGTISSVIQEIPSLIGKLPLPGAELLAKWADKFSQHPYLFLVFIAAIGSLIWRARVVRANMQDEMRNAWSHFTQISDRAVISPGKIRKAIGKFLDGAFYRNWIAAGLRNILETITIVIFLLVVAALTSRATLIGLDGFGSVCEAKQVTLLHPPGAGADFDDAGEPKAGFKLTAEVPADSPCVATGIKLKKKERYHIVWELRGKWQGRKAQEKSQTAIEADVSGWFGERPWWTYPAVLVRRHMLANWFQPIARIDNILLDRYVLKHTGAALPNWAAAKIWADQGTPKAASSQEDTEEISPSERCTRKPVEGKKRTIMCTTITARRSGQLYVYVNDAVLFTPKFPLEYYSDNGGTAHVSVIHLPTATAK